MRKLLSPIAFIFLFSNNYIYGQHSIDTVIVNELDPYTLITQQLDDSTIFVKRIYKTKDEINYMKHQIDDSIFYSQNVVEGKQYIKLIQFGLIDSVWIETSTVTIQNGKTISTREWNKEGAGVTRQYSENGNILSISEVVNFKNNGKYFGFYPNGILKEKGSFKDYLKTGEWIYFTEKGDTLSIENYLVKAVSSLRLEDYSIDELNEMQWGGTKEYELVSINHGIFKIFQSGKLVNVIAYEEGREVN